LQFGKDIVELKSAWQLVPQGQTPNPRMIRATVRIPTLRVADGSISEDYSTLRTVTAQLLAIHVASTIPGHPEFVWATFEATDAQGNSLVAPSAKDLPPRGAMTAFTQNIDTTGLGMRSFALFPSDRALTNLPIPTGQNA